MDVYYKQPILRNKKVVGWIYAEITPSGGRWYRQFLPSVRRWWFEVAGMDGDIDVGYEYEKGGSGGSYTLRGCLIKAAQAVDLMVERAEAGEFDEPKETTNG